LGDYHKKESEENVIPHIDDHDKVTMKKKSGGDSEFEYYRGENNVARASMPHIVGDNSDSVEWLKKQMMITMDLNNVDGEEYTGSVNGSSSNYLSIRNVVVIAMALVATTLML
jgi:hypothetical protein